jgi:hypothetical protein
MVPAEEVTLGELSRGLAALEVRINEQFGNVNRRLDSLGYVPRGEYELQIKNLQADIRELEDSKKWMVRSLVVAFLFPLVIGMVVTLVVNGP